jgi:hypothetical protein
VSEDTMPTDQPGRRRVPRWVLIMGGALLLIVVIVLVSIGVGGSHGEPGAARTNPPASSASATPSPTTTESPSGAPTPTPTDAASPAPSGSPAEGAPAVGTPEVPAPLNAPSQAVPGVTISVADLAAVEGEPRGAGELAGPALRFTVIVANTGDAAESLGTVVVNLYYGDDETPAPPVSGPDGSNLPAEVVGGGTVSGTYIFTVPKNDRDRVRIEVDYSTEAGVVVFEGAAPR